jgi:hypothetical protein
VLVIAGIQQMVRVDLRTIVSRRAAPGRDHARQRFRQGERRRLFPRRRPGEVGDPGREILEATSQLAQTTLRAVLGKHELDALLAERERLNTDIQRVLDAQTDAWGIKVSTVEIKHVDLNESMVARSRARPKPSASGARRSSTPKASCRPRRSCCRRRRCSRRQPQAMQLRYLQTLGNIAGDAARRSCSFPCPFRSGDVRLVGAAKPAG